MAQGATGYDIALRVPGTAVFGLVAVNVPTADFHFPPLPAGSYSAMVAGRNAAGLGEWSDALDFTLA